MIWNRKVLSFLLFLFKSFSCAFNWVSVHLSIAPAAILANSYTALVPITLWLSHCDHRSFLTIIFLMWFLQRQLFSPVLHFLDIFFKIEKIIASQSVLSSLSPNVLTENRTDHYMTRSHLLRIANRNWVSDPLFGLFLVISEVGSQNHIAILAIFKIWVFSATFWHEITLYAIDIDKKRFRTPFLTL